MHRLTIVPVLRSLFLGSLGNRVPSIKNNNNNFFKLNNTNIITRNLSWCSWDAWQHQLNFVHRLSWSISSNFSENLLSKCAPQPKIAKNSLKPVFLDFKVVQGHRCWYHWKARQQCFLWQAASLCLSATVLMLDEPIVVKLRFLRGVPLFDALIRGESPHPAAPNYLIRN